MKTILNPPNGDLDLYEKCTEKTKRNLLVYEDQIAKSFCWNGQTTIEYAAELITYARFDANFWRNFAMELVMEDRKNKKRKIK